MRFRASSQDHSSTSRRPACVEPSHLSDSQNQILPRATATLLRKPECERLREHRADGGGLRRPRSASARGIRRDIPSPASRLALVYPSPAPRGSLSGRARTTRWPRVTWAKARAWPRSGQRRRLEASGLDAAAWRRNRSPSPRTIPLGSRTPRTSWSPPPLPGAPDARISRAPRAAWLPKQPSGDGAR